MGDQIRSGILEDLTPIGDQKKDQGYSHGMRDKEQGRGEIPVCRGPEVRRRRFLRMGESQCQD